jgi:hypothetical protein
MNTTVGGTARLGRKTTRHKKMRAVAQHTSQKLIRPLLIQRRVVLETLLGILYSPFFASFVVGFYLDFSYSGQ